MTSGSHRGLVQRTHSIGEIADRYLERRDLADQRRDFGERLDQLHLAFEILSGINRVRSELIRHHIHLEPSIPTEALRDDLVAFASEVTEKKSVLIDPLQTRRLNDLLRRLHAVADDRTSRTKVDWRTYVTALIPSINAELLGVLRQVEAFREPIDQMQRDLGKMEEAVERLPASAGEITDVKVRADGIRSTWNELGGDGLPDEVLDFLRDSGSQGAAICMLTASVLDWLQEHDLEDSFVVRMRRYQMLG